MSAPTRFRRAGSRWRLLVHQMRPEGDSGSSVDVQSHASRRERDGLFSTEIVLPQTEFDELVVGSWLHVEQMGTGRWWMSVGGVVLHVDADRDGRPRLVQVHTAGEWDERRPGCRYVVDEQEEVPA